MVVFERYHGTQTWQTHRVNDRVIDMVNKQGKRRSTPPSRRRYETSHPTVSFRVDLDLYARLKELKEKANPSVADVLKVGLERCEPLVGEAITPGSWVAWLNHTPSPATIARTR